MKKNFTLTFVAVVLVSFFATLQPAMAAKGTYTLAEKRVVVALLENDVDRSLINDLQLNEMQYIKIKELSKKYKADAHLVRDNALEQLTGQYYSELSSLLSDNQIITTVQYSMLAKK